APLYADYTRAFDAAIPALEASLAHGGEVTTRAHYAGDRKLTHVEARLRWPLPIEYPTVVAEVGGVPIDTVFVPRGKGGFGALAATTSAVALAPSVIHAPHANTSTSAEPM